MAFFLEVLLRAKASADPIDDFGKKVGPAEGMDGVGFRVTKLWPILDSKAGVTEVIQGGGFRDMAYWGLKIVDNQTETQMENYMEIGYM